MADDINHPPLAESIARETKLGHTLHNGGWQSVTQLVQSYM